MSNEKIANEKIAKWCGYDVAEGWMWKPDWDVNKIDTMSGRVPDFPHDMNACVKYIIPKLNELGYLVRLDYCQAGRRIAHLEPDDYGWKQYHYECADTMPEALCNAVEKLLIGEKQNGI